MLQNYVRLFYYCTMLWWLSVKAGGLASPTIFDIADASMSLPYDNHSVLILITSTGELRDVTTRADCIRKQLQITIY